MEIASLGNFAAANRISTGGPETDKAENTHAPANTVNAGAEETETSLIPPPEPAGEISPEGSNLRGTDQGTGSQIDLII